MVTKKRKPTKSARSRTSLSREKIVNAAVVFADKHSLSELNMRQLAAELNCGAMSLYNYIEGTSDLYVGMIDKVVRDIELPQSDKHWKVALRDSAISAHRVLVAHPWVAPIWGMAYISPAQLRFFDEILKVMREAGFSEALACRGFHALTMHIVGFTQQELELPFKSREQFVAVAQGFLQSIDTARYPYVAEHVNHHLKGESGFSHYEYLLDLILDSLEKNAHPSK